MFQQLEISFSNLYPLLGKFYRLLDDDHLPNEGDERKQVFILLTCIFTNYNLIPFFEK
jgi:hypothetical protein